MNFDETFGKLTYFSSDSFNVDCVRLIVSACAEKGFKGYVSVKPIINGVEAVIKYNMYFCSPDNEEKTFKIITSSISCVPGTKFFSFESFLSPTPVSEVI